MAPQSSSSDNSGDDNDDLVINVDKEKNFLIHRVEQSSTIQNTIHNLFNKRYFQRNL